MTWQWQGRAGRRLLALLLLVACCLLAWRVLALGLADFWARSQPERALFWRPDHPEALFRLAERQAADKRWSEAFATAKRAQAANPLDGRPLRILAQVADAAGDQDLALQRYALAARLAPRDAATHLWLLNRALARRQPEAAVAHMDALLRLIPEARQALYPQAVLLAVHPLSRDAMVAALARNPPWRSSFLQALAASGQASPDILPVFLALRRIDASLPSQDYQPWLNRLIAEQRFEQAYLSWAVQLQEWQRPYMGNLFDGGFEVPFDTVMPGFGWQSWSLNGVRVEQLATAGTSGQNSLLLSFESQRTPFSHFRQLRALPEGDYRFIYRSKAAGLESSRGLVWRIRCAPDGPVLAQSEPMLGQYDWQQRSLPFTVPARCPGQELLLYIPARIPAETQIYGELWLDALSIEMLGTGS